MNRKHIALAIVAFLVFIVILYLRKTSTEGLDTVPDHGERVAFSTDPSVYIGPRGPQGPVGSPGPQGVQGFMGITGIRGLQGPQGLTGIPGIPGMRGIRGIPGEKGEEGDKGERGPQGYRGEVGLPGIPGMPGLRGPTGPDGIRGLDGLDGIEGDMGPMGLMGPMGDAGERGPTGPQGIKGIQGTQGIVGPNLCSGNNCDFTQNIKVVNNKLCVRDMCMTEDNLRNMIGIQRFWELGGVFGQPSFYWDGYDNPITSNDNIVSRFRFIGCSSSDRHYATKWDNMYLLVSDDPFQDATKIDARSPTAAPPTDGYITMRLPITRGVDNAVFLLIKNKWNSQYRMHLCTYAVNGYGTPTVFIGDATSANSITYDGNGNPVFADSNTPLVGPMNTNASYAGGNRGWTWAQWTIPKEFIENSTYCQNNEILVSLVTRAISITGARAPSKTIHLAGVCVSPNPFSVFQFSTQNLYNRNMQIGVTNGVDTPVPDGYGDNDGGSSIIRYASNKAFQLYFPLGDPNIDKVVSIVIRSDEQWNYDGFRLISPNQNNKYFQRNGLSRLYGELQGLGTLNQVLSIEIDKASLPANTVTISGNKFLSVTVQNISPNNMDVRAIGIENLYPQA